MTLRDAGWKKSIAGVGGCQWWMLTNKSEVLTAARFRFPNKANIPFCECRLQPPASSCTSEVGHTLRCSDTITLLTLLSIHYTAHTVQLTTIHTAAHPSDGVPTFWTQLLHCIASSIFDTSAFDGSTKKHQGTPARTKNQHRAH